MASPEEIISEDLRVFKEASTGGKPQGCAVLLPLLVLYLAQLGMIVQLNASRSRTHPRTLDLTQLEVRGFRFWTYRCPALAYH